ncbi:MAG: hypothetical protein ABJC79_10410, partial [Acidimicrobiia bacterium]
MAALDIAGTQSGVITRGQARHAGLTDGAIDGCVSNGLFRVVANHVYRVRGAPQTESMAVVSATLGARLTRVQVEDLNHSFFSVLVHRSSAL